MGGTLAEKYFGDAIHPYARLEDVVRQHLRPDAALLDAGCGHGAPVLRKFLGAARELVGVDVVNFDSDVPGLRLVNRNLTDTGLSDESFDVVMSRSVMEHITDPAKMYLEMHRILQPGGYFIFLTGNMWDYSAIIAKLVPNRYHPCPEMHQTQKNKQWYFGIKVHVGAGKQGLMHSVATGPANEADITRLDALVHGEEHELYGDQAHCQCADIAYRVNRRAKPHQTLTDYQKAINRSRSRRRARGEFAFHVVKRLWGFAKVRYPRFVPHSFHK